MTRAARFIPYLIALATLVVFGSLCRHEFTSWDDVYNLSYNARFNPPTLEKLAWYWRNQSNGLYVPVTYTAWGVLAKIAYLDQANELGIRLNPYVFHTANVLLHVVSALLVYAIVRTLVKHDWAACVGALVFALHPVQVEPVAWVSGLKDVLCGCLSFAAIGCYLRAVTSMDSKLMRGRRATLYAFGTIALVLAMLAKPTAMVVPAIAFVLHVWGLQRPAREAFKWLAPWLALSLACAIVAKLAQPAHGVSAAPLWARPFVAGDSLAFYLFKLVFPARLAIDYGWRPPLILREWWFYVAWLAPAALLVWLLLNRKRYPELWAAGAVFVIGVAPVLGLTTFLFQNFSTVADHYLYLSMLGPALATAWLVSRWPTRNVMLLSIVPLVALGVRSLAQTQVWQNDFTLFTHTVEVNPSSFMSWNNLGYAQRLAGDLPAAERSFRSAIAVKDDFADAHRNLADLLFATGRNDEAVAHVRRMIEIKSSLPKELGIDVVEDRVKLGDTLMSLARYAEAADEYRRALELRPDHATARRKLDEAMDVCDSD